MKFIDEKFIQNSIEKLQDASPQTIAAWALQLEGPAVVTTNFRPYEAALLHCLVRLNPKIPVIWCDTGYNTRYTYDHAAELRSLLGLNLKIYVPRHTVGYRDVTLGRPDVHDPDHALFTEEVKLEPFNRAMAEFQPAIWFTNIRKGQTAIRDRLDILSATTNGILKVSPFYHWDDTQLDKYLSTHDLPNEFRYSDPTKVLENRECGLHN